MKGISLILIASFTVLTLLGIWSIHQGMQSHNGGCIAAVTQGTDCPQKDGFLDFLSFHVDAFKDLATVTLTNAFALTSLILLAIMATGRGGLAGATLPTFVPERVRASSYRSFSSKQKRADWLAFHQNSPTF